MPFDISKLDSKLLDEFNSLSESEKNIFLKVLDEFSNNGSSSTLIDLYKDDFDEIPVTIEEFLHNPEYLGKGLIGEDGKFTVFPYWVDVLKKVFPNNIQTAYRTLVLSGGIGLGKSFVAVLCILYQLYRMMCLKNPYTFYGLQPIDKITFSFMNITLDASKGVAWDKAQSLLQASPWFMARGTVSGRENIVWTPPKGIELIAGSQPRHVIGRAVFSNFCDEISFIPNQDVAKQVEKAKLLISTIDARMQSRFMKGEFNPTLNILASSKRTDQSFLETYIENKKTNESKTTLVIDEPQWVIRTDKDSPNKFWVAVGNKFLESELVPLDATDEDLKTYTDRGYTLLAVPSGYYEQFVDNINIALTDIAGISTSSTSRYISGVRIKAVKHPEFKNPFIKDILEIGNAPDDTDQYQDYFDLSRIPEDLIRKPLYIHLDMSISGDKTGIAGTWIIGKKPTAAGQEPSRDLFYRLAFSVSIKAPKGYQISFEKNRNFIRWLKNSGFNICGISYDTFNSADLGQVLSAEGFNCSIISVDRVKDNVCIPYQTLKNTIYEERVQIYEDCQLLTEELIGLERFSNGKIDHTAAGINCFTGDTKVRLVDGRSLTFLELVDEYNSGKTNYVYSINLETHRIEPKPILKAWCSGKNAKLLEITLDNDEIIKCTPNHKFMLRNGEYCFAKDLMIEDSLMPLYTKYPNRGLSKYRMYYEPFEDSWHYEHRQFAKEVFDEKYLVHHKNCNPCDNNPDNLIWMSKAAHVLKHSELQTGAQSPESKSKRIESLKANYKLLKNKDDYYCRWHPGMTPEEAKAAHDLIVANNDRVNNKILEINKLFNIDYNSLSCKDKNIYMIRYSNFLRGYDIFSDKAEKADKKRLDCQNYFNVDYSNLSEHERRSLSIKYARHVDPTYQERVSKAVSENHKLGKYKNAEKALQSINSKNKMLKKLFPKIDKDKFFELFGFYYEDLPREQKGPWTNRYRNKLYDIKNHSIKSIRYLDYVEDVYDIEVEDNHNFALDAGVFVHNSKDQADSFAGSLYNASLHAEEYAYDFGEDLDNLASVNTSSPNGYEEMSLLSNQLFDKSSGTSVSGAQVIKDIDDILNLDSDILVW